MGFFDLPFINHIRRNHGLEHATVHVLSRRKGNLSVVGRSDWGGFTLYGPLDTGEVEQAAREALDRMRRGEAHLAVHPRCGTMLVTTGALTAVASFLAIKLDSKLSGRTTWNSIPSAMLAATLAAIVAQPLGLLLQERYTTDGNPGSLEISSVNKIGQGNLVAHRVNTRQG